MSQVDVRLLHGNPAEIEKLQKVLEGAPNYSKRITGCPPGADDAESLCSIIPEGVDYEDKFVYGIYLDKEMIGCIDVLRGYPKEGTALIGLFLLAETYQQKGYGSLAFELLKKHLSRWEECQILRLGNVRTNEVVFPFWKKMGFAEIGEVKPFNYNEIESEVVVMERPLYEV